MMEIKNEENKRLVKMLMDAKRNKNKSEVKEKISQMHESRVSALRNQNKYQ